MRARSTVASTPILIVEASSEGRFNSFRYRVTQFGLRATLVFTRACNRLLRPESAGTRPGLHVSDATLKRALDKIDHINASINQAKLAVRNLTHFA
jgi:hypothetical protein